MAGEVNLVVARVRIVGDLKLAEEAPAEVEGSPGDKLLVKFPFLYEEVSRHKDDFRLQLTSKFLGKEAPPSRHEHVDRRGIVDDQRGFVMQKYDLPGPGDYELEWRAAAEYTEDGERFHHALEGTVQVKVIDATPPPL